MVDLEFKFISKENYNCIENVLVTLMLTWEREYALMFSRNWGFTMLPEEQKMNLLGPRIGGGIYHTWECLNEYAGVATKEISGVSKVQKQVLQTSLAEGNPVIIKMDGYYAPWKDVFKKYHLQHYCLVVSLEKEGYGCLDPYVNSNVNVFPYEYFDIADTRCILIEAGEARKAVDLNKILKEAADIILMQEGTINGIHGIRAFADTFEDAVDLKAEMAGYEDMIWIAPIIYQITDIGSRRLNFSETLTALHNRYGFQELEDMSARMEKNGWEWRRIRRTIVAAMDKTERDQRSRIASMIRKVADDEEAVAKDIVSFLEKVN
jgi:hypothetical protein